LSPDESRQLRVRGQARAEQPRFERREIVLRAQGSVFSGQLEGVWIGQRRPASRLRIQLFPDVGSKVVDLAVGPTSLAVGRGPGTKPYRWRFSEGGEKLRRPLSVLGLSLQRYWAGVEPGDVVGVRTIDGGYVLRLAPHRSGVGIDVVVNERMQVERWQFHYLSGAWELEVGPPLRLLAGDAVVVIETTSTEVVEDLEPRLFDISLPSGGS